MKKKDEEIRSLEFFYYNDSEISEHRSSDSNVKKVRYSETIDLWLLLDPQYTHWRSGVSKDPMWPVLSWVCLWVRVIIHGLLSTINSLCRPLSSLDSLASTCLPEIDVGRDIADPL